MKTIRDLPEEIHLSNWTRQRLAPETTLRNAVRIVQQNDDALFDAIRIFPHAVPKRLAVWWGCLVVWRAMNAQADEQERQTLQAIVRWLQRPEETHRRAVRAALSQQQQRSLVGSLGMAVFYSDGSLSAPGLPLVPPKPWLTAQLIGATVLRAAARLPEGTLFDRYREALHLGIEVATGRNLWTPDGQLSEREADTGATHHVVHGPTTTPPGSHLHSHASAHIARNAAGADETASRETN